MSEQDPTVELLFKGEPFEASRHNTTIYTFWGEIALFNHVFIQTAEAEENRVSGSYVFCDSPLYPIITEVASENYWPMILNRNEVAECDVQAWNNAHLADLGDYLPEAWGGAA